MPATVVYAVLVAVVFWFAGKTTSADPIDDAVSSTVVARSRESDAERTERQYMSVAGKLWCPYCSEHVHTGSKHCRLCDKCVAVFDHHCKWLNNCIGQRNYATFFVTISAAFTILVRTPARLSRS